MDPTTIFLTQLATSVLVFSLLARWVLEPWLGDKPLRIALMILIAPHALRHIGLSFLVPGVVNPALPATFASAAAYGDFAAGLLAVLALLALRNHWRSAIPIAWAFSLVGIVDLGNALRQAAVIPYLEAAWFIPTLFVPLLLVTHFMVLTRLLQKHRKGLPRSALHAKA